MAIMRTFRLTTTFPALITATGVILLTSLPAEAQTTKPQHLHQIFLEEKVQSIDNVEYEDSGSELKYELSPEGESIRLFDYDGKTRIKVEYTSPDGTKGSFARSKCHIDAWRLEI